MAEAGQVEAARQAVVVALDWTSSADARQAATAYLESVKSGNVHTLAAVAYSLVRQEQSSEVRLYGFKMLQHLIRLRWDELSPEEHRQMAQMALNMIQEVAKPHEQWALKSQAAALVAEVSRRGGPPMWKEMLPSLFSLSTSSAIHSELVAMVLRWLPEDVTVHNEDLEGERRRQLLFGLTQTLPETLPFLFQLLETHFTAAMTFTAAKQEEAARQHAQAVTATLNAIVAYAEWAPVTSMVEYRLVEACAILQKAPQFRLSACEVLKLIAARRKPADDTAPLFMAAIVHVFEALSTASEAFLMHIGQQTSETLSGTKSNVEESDIEYGECLCEAMVALGSQNLSCIVEDESRLGTYLRRMLGFLQLRSYALHSQALPLWLTLLRDTASSVVNKADSVGPASSTENGLPATHAEKEKKGVAILITEELCAVLLELAFHRLLMKSPEEAGSDNMSWIQDFSTAIDYRQSRGRLLELVRLIATIRPLVAVTHVSQQMDVVLNIGDSSHPSSQELSSLQTTQVMLETVINGIPEPVMAAEASSKRDLGLKLEGIFTRLYNIEWKIPGLVELLGSYLDAMGPFLKHSQAAVPMVIEKLFALLVSLPAMRMDQVQDAAAANSLKEISRARLQVCTSFLRVAKAADTALLPYAQRIATTMEELQQQGRLPRGEVNLLGEGLLIVGSAGGNVQHGQVLDWLLGPFRMRWQQPEWQQRFLSSPSGIVDLLSCRDKIFVGPAANDGKSYNEEIWFVYHTVTFFERALRRCAEPKKSKSPSLMVSHLQWMLPPLLKLLRCIHALWSEAIMPTLPAEVRGALAMGVPEQLSLLGTAGSQGSGGNVEANQMESNSNGMDTKENDIRTWLKGIRDSGYNVLGLAALRIGDDFFDDTDGRAAACAVALVENINYMEMHHLRQLNHSVIVNFVKHCPRPHWVSWLGRLLPRVLVHCQAVLSSAWSSLIREGAVRAPVNWVVSAAVGSDDGSSRAIKTEVILEKLLRDLTRETCHVLAVIAILSPRQQIPSEHQPGTEVNMIIGSDTMIGFLMQQREAARAALLLGIEALEWPDSETVHKAVNFCSAVVSMASVLTDLELQEIVGQNMFLAAIRGLTLESNATGQAELIGLLREIYIRLSAHSQAPRQVLLSLPSITPEVLAAFEKALGKTSSTKEQRQLVKNLLLTAGGDQLKALKAQKNTNVITNVTNRLVEMGIEHVAIDSGPIGLASIVM
ncbi:exportin-5 [Marchantia polymorpha subsp. ruderalis]|uniref:Uncharacterized protein n=2 Tax=Marchantia polymorpha TaxID=3197 RepID=A0A176VFA8_MARPO|nr:hypothetical protein AXG93_909s1070 [Marchantia polymorpha subsp. ruderalis]PTQ45409.1 hypothetical protein MARPO_0015s0189 [Marchantia polymorpha]BBN01643.1 hypothetical protein Mp_2g09050 [Marchantia polymorpha subsp. ruderalis]|eukprot:PTQ45409.1 hypothetical protein MARPO_0015s0189 [Marchantia polymorpha]